MLTIRVDWRNIACNFFFFSFFFRFRHKTRDFTVSPTVIKPFVPVKDFALTVVVSQTLIRSKIWECLRKALPFLPLPLKEPLEKWQEHRSVLFIYKHRFSRNPRRALGKYSSSRSTLKTIAHTTALFKTNRKRIMLMDCRSIPVFFPPW